MHFCQICPTPMLELVRNRPVHLTLAHLQEVDSSYVKFYKIESSMGSTIIQDNSAFEMWKAGRPMYPTNKLLDLAQEIDADYVVMSDYPDKNKEITIEAAQRMAPDILRAGRKTFFVPQAIIGDIQGLLDSYMWALTSPLIDYIAFSILNIPNAYGVESNNKLQRYLSRFTFIKLLEKHVKEKTGQTLEQVKVANKKLFHFLGMVDGPNEIDLIKTLDTTIDSWDSSAAIWAGLNGIAFDSSPTGLINGKFEKHVDFSFYTGSKKLIQLAKDNMKVIDDKSV